MNIFVCVFLLISLGFSVTAEPVLLKGFFNDGALILEKADSRFLDVIDNVLQNSRLNVAAEGLQRLAEAAAATVSNIQTDGNSAASVLFAPISDHDTSLLLSPIVLSESVLRDLAETGRSALKIALPFNTITPQDLSQTSVGNVLDSVSDIAVPVETSATRETVKRTINAIPENMISLRSSIINTLKAAASPVATLERNVEGALRKTVAETIPVRFGPLLSLGLEV